MHFLLSTQLFENLENTKVALLSIWMISLPKQFVNWVYNVIQITERIINYLFLTKVFENLKKYKGSTLINFNQH
jgi:hypothetical protein